MRLRTVKTVQKDVQNLLLRAESAQKTVNEVREIIGFRKYY